MTDTAESAASEVSQESLPIDLAEFRGAMADLELEDIIDELVVTFLDDAPKRMAAIESAVGSAVAEEIRKSAHAYKSATANLYAKKLTHLLQELESAGAEGDTESAAALLPVVRSEHDAAVAQLREHF